MCGIFGVVANKPINRAELGKLARHAEQRGKDSSGLFLLDKTQHYSIIRSSGAITQTLKRMDLGGATFVMGHSRLMTNGQSDNQPIYRDGICVMHNGIVVNHTDLWVDLGMTALQQIDTEIIAAIAASVVDSGRAIAEIADEVLRRCKGTVACALAIPKNGKLLLFSNNGSLYVGEKDGLTLFSSERYPLSLGRCVRIRQIRREALIIDIPVSDQPPSTMEYAFERANLLPALGKNNAEEKLLEWKSHSLRRCTRCILPETMPFIKFDANGVCNYCNNYKPRNKPKPISELFNLVEPYRRNGDEDCIVPFSGGRDSCYGLHLIVNELKMKPIAYTYDWGMVTDLGRRNISRMCSELGVENIIVADDIDKKRRYIALNFSAWLKSPNLGMVSILTAGDKHFFRHVETVKKQTGIGLNLWGVNPLEVTHFKAGFLGVPPDFEEQRVYSSGAMKQIRYQWLRLRAMLDSPGYFNNSLWDTLSGEYYRSFSKKLDYYHIFDYWRWDEKIIDTTLSSRYEWERAPDTSTTWRIGDGTAAIYNYIYYTAAGFTEHDTFRSNQIREGDIDRAAALEMVLDENRPRYQNIKWYLDALGMDFVAVIKRINGIPRVL
jgi:glucosamine--fructose-6-phosphate aminotransferase (isomerizing)